MKEVRIVCKKWDGRDYTIFSSSIDTDYLEGKEEFTYIQEDCSPKNPHEGFAYEYSVWEDGVIIPSTIKTVYHPTRDDLL